MSNYRRPREKSYRSPSGDSQRDKHLLNGGIMPGWGFERHNGVFDEAAAAAYWERHRERLMQAWIAEKKPGTRCWYWWRTEATQFDGGRRRRVDGKQHPFDCKARSLYVAQNNRQEFWRKAYALTWGMPQAFIPPFDEDLYRDYMKNILHGRDSEIFEPEWSFLQRHNLLVPEDGP